MTAPSDLSVVIGLALLTTDRDPDEDAALARVIAVAGLGDLFPGTQGTPAVSSLTEGDDEDRCYDPEVRCSWCELVEQGVAGVSASSRPPATGCGRE